MDGWTDEMTNENPPVFYRTLFPSGPLPCFLSLHITIMQSRATGIADHILPLGDLLHYCSCPTVGNVYPALFLQGVNVQGVNVELMWSSMF